jgi:hypothetical protein
MEGGTMKKAMQADLTQKLSEVIEPWLSGEIDAGAWQADQYPHFGRHTCYLMAQAAIVVLTAIYDAEIDLVREGMLDPDMAILPGGK